MPSFSGHEQLKNRYCFTGKLILETPLRISSGRASESTDAPVMKTIDGTPYIPGSSLRGAIRSEIERILAAVGESTSGLKGCILFEGKEDEEEASEKHSDKFRDCAKAFNDKMKKLDQKKTDQKSKKEAIDEFLQKGLCDICRLFGSTMLASRLVIEDALPSAGDTKTRIRDGVAIHRDNGAAVEGAKFDYEVILAEKSTGFNFKMTAENLDAKDKKLVNLVLKVLKNGLYTGGKRSGGLGKIRLDAGVKVNGFHDPAALWAALQNNQPVMAELKDWKEDI